MSDFKELVFAIVKAILATAAIMGALWVLIG
jgi:hypothetical protein